MIVLSTSFETMSSTSCDLLQEHPHCISTTETTSCNSFNLSHFLLIISRHITSLFVHSQDQHTTFCIIHFIFSSWEANQANSSSLSQMIILKHTTSTTSLLPFTLSIQFHHSQLKLQVLHQFSLSQSFGFTPHVVDIPHHMVTPGQPHLVSFYMQDYNPLYGSKAVFKKMSLQKLLLF